MATIKQIDYAIFETLKAHPEFRKDMSSIILKCITRKVYPSHFTRENSAREIVKTASSMDFLEYILKQAINISEYYKGAVHYKLFDSKTLQRCFPGIEALNNAKLIVNDSSINAFSYYLTNGGKLYELILAVLSTRFNNYMDLKPYIDDYEKNNQEELSLIDKDLEKLNSAENIHVNYNAFNRCLEELKSGAQLKHERVDYTLDGTLFASSTVGQKRTNQEDSVIILTHPQNPDFKLLAVADGMGGTERGEEASSYLLKEISDWFNHLPAEGYYYLTDIANNYEEKLKQINNDLCQNVRGGGSTLVSAIVFENETLITNIGDSRAYTYDDNGLRLITRDDSVVWKEMEYKAKENNKQITDTDINNLRFASRNNVISNAFGYSYMEVNSFPVNNHSYDKLLLFSDGVTDLLSMDDIYSITANSNPETISNIIITQALNQSISAYNEEGKYVTIPAGKDNATVAMFNRR